MIARCKLLSTLADGDIALLSLSRRVRSHAPLRHIITRNAHLSNGLKVRDYAPYNKQKLFRMKSLPKLFTLHYSLFTLKVRWQSHPTSQRSTLNAQRSALNNALKVRDYAPYIHRSIAKQCLPKLFTLHSSLFTLTVRWQSHPTPRVSP